MPLQKQILESRILNIFNSYPSTTRDAANKIAKAYASYCAGAQAAGSPVILTGAEETAMAAVLYPGFISKGNLALFTQSMVQGVFSFWLAPPVPFAGGAVTVAWTGAPALQVCLRSLVNPKISIGAAARRIATCLDTATRLVFVQPPTPTPPVPVT